MYQELIVHICDKESMDVLTGLFSCIIFEESILLFEFVAVLFVTGTALEDWRFAEKFDTAIIGSEHKVKEFTLFN